MSLNVTLNQIQWFNCDVLSFLAVVTYQIKVGKDIL